MIRNVDFASSESWSWNWNTSEWKPTVAQGGWAGSWSHQYAKSYSWPESRPRSGAWVKNRNDSWHWRDNL